ncbi:MAG: DoxX family protein [Candidatus Eremiobacteraeota bacterium]|nr:DoxX family protein [Candidatus Eremiobacteraeota bacterium]
MVATTALGIFFVAAGINHFVNVEFYIRIVPPGFPYHLRLVQISGIAEILGGVGILVPRTRNVAGIGLIVLLVMVFPANLEMAQHPERYADLGNATLFYARLPLQFILIALVWWICLKSRRWSTC